MTVATFDLYCSIGTSSFVFGGSIIMDLRIIILIFCQENAGFTRYSEKDEDKNIVRIS